MDKNIIRAQELSLARLIIREYYGTLRIVGPHNLKMRLSTVCIDSENPVLDRLTVKELRMCINQVISELA